MQRAKQFLKSKTAAKPTKGSGPKYRPLHDEEASRDGVSLGNESEGSSLEGDTKSKTKAKSKGGYVALNDSDSSHESVTQESQRKTKRDSQLGASSRPRAAQDGHAKLPRVRSLAMPADFHVDHHIMTLDQVAEATGASAAHDLGVTGKGVHVVILDSGYFPHAYFQAKYPHADIQVQRLAVSAYPGGPLMQPLGNEGEDLNGHGTAMVANVLALAPEAKITMIVCRSDLEALKHAFTLGPDVISVSRGPTYGGGKGANNDIGARSTLIDTYQTIMADGNAGLKKKAIVLDAVGNMGARGMLSLLPGVISVGGTYLDEHGELEASSYTNAYSLTDEIYRASKNSPPGFVTKPVLPEITGLCGTEAHPDFLILPTQPGSELETKVGPQGWGLASGSSCATPQVAGACALLKQVNPKLTTAQALAILHATGTQVTAGHGHVDKNKGDEGIPGKSGLKADGSWSRLINMGAAVARAKQLLDV